MKIYISGSLAYDRIMDFPGRFSDHILPDKLHILNVCFTVNGMAEKFGGTAGNVAYTLSLLGERPVVVATIGKDYQTYFAWLEKNGVPREGIRIIGEEFTAGAYITTDRADNQITGFNPGAMKHRAGYPLEKGGDGAICLIAPGNLADMIGYAEECRGKGIPFICDPGQSLTQWNGNDLREWIRGALMLITNDYELELVMKMTGEDKKGLLSLTGTLITTLGEKGSLVSTPGADVAVPAAAARSVVDPTGAGDSYRSGLLKGIAAGKDIVTAAKMGTVAAAYAVEQYGTQEHAFSSGDFERRYRETFGEG
ncbi:MAG: carbohydrate kinase family protein [Nitrospiraceae bacterium]|nr:carbohydrate kinase family protein [Nitrospiraceae bacterium]